MRLQPRVRNDVGDEMGLIDYYNTIMNILETNKEAREGTIGYSPVEGVSQEYHMISVQRELGIPPHEWRKVDIEDRAKLVAHAKLSKMVEICDSFKRWQSHMKEKAKREAERRAQNKRK